MTILVMDLGGVTCAWVPDRRLVSLAELSGLPPATVDGLVFESGLDDAGERGQFTLPAFLDALRSVLNLGPAQVSDDDLRRAWASAFEPNRRVLALIDRATCPAALFTNNGPLLEAALGHDLAEVGDVFDRLVFSWHLGTTKPDPTSFPAAADVLDVDPREIVFVDDSEANVDAARVAGWRAHRYTDALNLAAALTNEDVL